MAASSSACCPAPSPAAHTATRRWGAWGGGAGNGALLLTLPSDFHRADPESAPPPPAVPSAPPKDAPASSARGWSASEVETLRRMTAAGETAAAVAAALKRPLSTVYNKASKLGIRFGGRRARGTAAGTPAVDPSPDDPPAANPAPVDPSPPPAARKPKGSRPLRSDPVADREAIEAHIAEHGVDRLPDGAAMGVTRYEEMMGVSASPAGDWKAQRGAHFKRQGKGTA